MLKIFIHRVKQGREMAVWVEINLENKIPAKLFLNLLECTNKIKYTYFLYQEDLFDKKICNTDLCHKQMTHLLQACSLWSQGNDEFAHGIFTPTLTLNLFSSLFKFRYFSKKHAQAKTKRTNKLHPIDLPMNLTPLKDQHFKNIQKLLAGPASKIQAGNTAIPLTLPRSIRSYL